MPYIYPTAAEFSEIQQELMTSEMGGRVGMELFPIEEANTFKVRWSQEDNYYGLQQLRGLDGAPTRVQRTGEKLYEYEPGVFGEFIQITETELTTRAENINLLSTNVPIDDLVMKANKQLIGREMDRIEASIWTLVTTGTISIPLDIGGSTGVGYLDTYVTQTYSPTAWTATNATPILDFQYVQQQGEAWGISADFGSGAKAYMNGYTANKLINNSNNSDLNGRRNNMGATLNNLTDIGRYFGGQNLAQPVVYDRGYQATINSPRATGSFTKFIPNNIVVFVAQRPQNARVGAYKMCRNIVNGGAPGSYGFVKDTFRGPDATKVVPPNIQCHRGHNGGPTIYYPSAILVATVG